MYEINVGKDAEGNVIVSMSTETENRIAAEATLKGLSVEDMVLNILIKRAQEIEANGN